jgi:hypothetical protein
MHPLLQVFRLAANACGTRTGVLPSLYDGITCDGNGVPMIKTVAEGVKVIANGGRILIAVSGGLAVIVIIAGAMYYIASAGDPGRIKRGKDIIINTTVGLAIIMVAYGVVTFIAKGF